jgi:GNAT superfamily N-acetyltransferase
VIRPAVPKDVPAIARLVRELAEYERAPHEVHATEAHFAEALFGDEPKVFAHVAEADGEVVGVAMWFVTFSTWQGRHGIWLEDLFVRPEQRGAGHGLALLRRLAEICVERGYGRLEWWVLDWNESSIRFYRALGATPQDEWTRFRLDGDALAALGAVTAERTASGPDPRPPAA